MRLTEALEILETNGYYVMNEVGSRYMGGRYVKDMGGISKEGIDNLGAVSEAEAILNGHEGDCAERKDRAWKIISELIPQRLLAGFKANWDAVSPTNTAKLVNMVGQAWAITSHRHSSRLALSNWSGKRHDWC